MTTLVRAAHSERISTNGWEFGFGDFDPIISKGIDEALETTLEDMPPELWMPFSWGHSDGVGGGPVSDPLTLYVNMSGLSEHCDTGPLWQTTLGDIVRECLDSWRDDDDRGPLEEEPAAKAIQIRDALRSLADHIDSEIARIV